MKVDCCHHLFNPFSQGPVKLTTWQKGVAITSLVALAPLLLFPGLVAFWGLTYYFKATQINLQQQDTENAVSRTHAISRKTLSSTDSNNDTHAEDTSSLSGSEEAKTPSSPNSMPLPPLVSDDSDIDEDKPVLPISNLSPLDQLHRSRKIQNHFNDLRSSNSDKVAIFERIKEQVSSWQKYLGYLSQHQFEDFNFLLGIALDTENPEIYIDFIRALNPEQLNKHLELLNNCQIIFEDNVLPVHKTLLRHISPYFESMFSSEMREAQTNEIHLQEREDYELFNELLPSAMSFYLFDKKLDLSGDNLTQYLELAAKYQLSQLEKACKKWILHNLKNIDPCNLFDLADQYGLESVKSALVEEILQTYRKNVGFTQLQKKMLSQWLPRIKKLEVQKDPGNELQPLLKLCANLHTLKIGLYGKQTIKLLKELPSLKNLAIDSTYHWKAFSDQDIKDLHGLPITSINIIHSPLITDRGLEYLKDLPLKSLTIAHCNQITDEGLAHLRKSPLEALTLSFQDQITDRGLEHLKGLPLKKLEIERCGLITDEGLAHLKKLPLKSLRVLLQDQITDQGLEYLKDLPLEFLSLSLLGQITDQGLEHLKKLPLKKLNLVKCQRITNDGLAHLRKLPLKKLNLVKCQHITDDGLAHLRKLSSLKALTLSSLDQITDYGLKHLKELKLKSLTLGFLEKITDPGLAHLAKLSLSSFTIEQCDRITASHILSLRKAMPHTNIKFRS
ncbi:MAG: BTB/POZ domain-containing protein [Parachlamydiaceae bacterium]